MFYPSPYLYTTNLSRQHEMTQPIFLAPKITNLVIVVYCSILVVKSKAPDSPVGSLFLPYQKLINYPLFKWRSLIILVTDVYVPARKPRIPTKKMAKFLANSNRESLS